MIKHLTLIRHAKSSWDNTHLPDHARCLNDRGHRDALRMGGALHKRKIKFDLVLCSSAKRANETLSLLRKKLEIEDACIRYLDDLYCASTATLVKLIRRINDAKNDIAIVAHNPGIEDLAAILSNDGQTFTTCNVMQIEFKIDSWEQVGKITGKQSLFLKPKML